MITNEGCKINTAKCKKEDWRKLGKYKVLPNCCVKHLKEVLFYLHDLFEKENIHYWLDFGTLLGAVRTGKIIPHDSDGDMGLFYYDRKKILKLRKTIKDDGFCMFVHKSHSSKEANIHGRTVIRIARSEINHMTVDLFFWKLNNFTHRLTSDGLNKFKSFPDVFIQSRKEITMLDKKMWGPNYPKEFLKFRYGRDWHIEKKKKVNFGFAKITHKGIFKFGNEKIRKITIL